MRCSQAFRFSLLSLVIFGLLNRADGPAANFRTGLFIAQRVQPESSARA
jgi:hypothetical protein